MVVQNVRTGCPECARLHARVAELETQLAAARKTSRTSSKPPSSDIVKPPKPKKGRKKRKRGAQPGHPHHQRPAFTPEQITQTQDYTLECCPDCGGTLVESEAMPEFECESCGKIVPVPSGDEILMQDLIELHEQTVAAR